MKKTIFNIKYFKSSKLYKFRNGFRTFQDI